MYKLKHFKYSSHYWVLRAVEEKNRPLRILDMGTADGYLGAVLSAAGHSVVGVERDPALAARAREHYERLDVSDLESFDFPFGREFDVILFADVLEHLRDPVTVFKRAISVLKPSGEVLISLPNVANFTVRIALLLGRFDYANRGILDRTHLRFFTLRTAKKLLADCSFRCVSVVPTPVPIQLILPFTDHRAFAFFHEAHYLSIRMLKGLMAYQFVLRGVPGCTQQQ